MGNDVMTTCDYDPDTFSFFLSPLTLTTPALLFCCTITYLVVPLSPFLSPPLYSYHSLALHSLDYDLW